MIVIKYATYALALCAASSVFGGQLVESKKEIAPPEEDHWKFVLSVPGWMAGAEGTVGVQGFNSNVDVSFRDILPHIDMIWSTAVEVSKGRFGALGELIYLSASDGIGTDGPVQKLDVRVDEYLVDFTLRYRLIEGRLGFVDLLAGVRYTNLFQHASVAGNQGEIDAAAANIVDHLGDRVRERILENLNGRALQGAESALEADLAKRLADILGRNGRTGGLPMAPLLAERQERLDPVIAKLVDRKLEELVRNTRAAARAAAAADKEAAQARVAVVRERLVARAAELRARIDRRINDTKTELADDIAHKLTKALNQQKNLDEAWWDPYVGLRARLNLSPAVYLIARGDIGGFGVGSDLMWQAEGALGFQLTRSVFAEVGYRALSFDYNHDGFLYDVVTRGAQITVGKEF